MGHVLMLMIGIVNLSLTSLTNANGMHIFMLLVNICSPTAIVLSIVIVIGSIVPAENQYNIHSFPPLRCVNRTGNYYNRILPVNVILLVGNTLLAVIGWVIHKVS